jgi:hypothetical protein
MQKIVVLLLAALLVLRADSQDYIVTWNNDTLYCELPGKPGKKGLKPAGNYKNGYMRIAAIFAGDSVRAFEPGQIRGYFRKEHGNDLLCDGNFESVKIPEGDGFRTLTGPAPAFNWSFLLVEKKGKYASLYKMLRRGKRIYTYYYVVKHHGEHKDRGLYLGSRNRQRKVLVEDDISAEMLKAIKTTKKYTDIVDEYNRLKESAATGKPEKQAQLK